jgi:hypothetical protein
LIDKSIIKSVFNQIDNILSFDIIFQLMKSSRLMPKSKLFSQGVSPEHNPLDPLRASKELIESKEQAPESPEATDLTTDQDFIEGGAQVDFVAEQQAASIILLIKSKLDNIEDKEEQEKTAYAIIKELEGLRGLEIPQVKYTGSTYNNIVDAVANQYTTDQQYVNRIKTIVGVKVYPNDAKVLRAYFTNFPNIFNNGKIEIKPAEDTARSNSPSLGGWF